MDRKGSRSKRSASFRKTKCKYRRVSIAPEKSEYASTSARKIQSAGDADFSVNKKLAYTFIDFFTVFSTLATLVVCKECYGGVSFERKSERGLGFAVCMKCKKCRREISINSCPMIVNAYEINRRVVFAFRLLGVGFEGLKLFCGLMDLCNSFSMNLYYLCLEKIHSASASIYDSLIQRAAAQERELTDSINLTVSGDGTWKKRGFSSLFGAASLIGKHTRKVIDSIVKSKLCQACKQNENLKKEDIEAYNLWYESHADNCTITHEGSSGKMEVDAIIEMFSRSVEKFGVRYTNYIGDGDSKTFKGILDLDPYGERYKVKKSECVGHVEKRMGTRLRNAKKNNKGIGGKGAGKLTDNLIGQLTRYYGLAIRRHPDSIEDMRREIWATFYHKSSSDKNPQHENCPQGKDSWCAWRKAEADGTLRDFRHDYSPLSETVQKIIQPIYESLSNDDLLSRCVGAENQNSNESLNSLIWTFAPKHIHCGAKTIEVANHLAICIFNEGFTSMLQIMDAMGVSIGKTSESCSKSRDKSRIIRSEGRLSDFAKKARIERRKEDSANNEFAEIEEGVMYGPGIAV